MSEATSPGHEHTVIESLQSLIVAFVLAMTFRGFVTEGFVIPTGSMAPTLMGQHVLVHSDQTGAKFPVGIMADRPPRSLERVPDPYLGPRHIGSAGASRVEVRPRMGDRILVDKIMYPFREPERFDVVVFKNPTDPDGPSANYIKRLIGLPDEKVWLIDGDVFAAPNEAGVTYADAVVQRKPEHVQRAVWQRVFDSDFVPQAPDRLYPPYEGSPWQGPRWNTDGRVYATDTAEATALRWDDEIRSIDDWTSYNSEDIARVQLFPVSDVRVGAGVEADHPRDLHMTFRLTAREHVFEFVIDGGGADGEATAVLRWGPREPGGTVDSWTATDPAPIDLPGAGGVFDVEFWHADQALRLFIDGRQVAEATYDWSAKERLEWSAGSRAWDDTDDLVGRLPNPPELRWEFEGTPLRLCRVRTDRDLHYRPATLDAKTSDNPTAPGFEERVMARTPALATHPDKPAALGHDHFFMLGDNSQASFDSRLWGNPHPLVAAQFDPTPFVVHRDLLIGKAFVVYFPAPLFARPNKLPIIPDFGRMRFIR